jgi:hypothetical protein
MILFRRCRDSSRIGSSSWLLLTINFLYVLHPHVRKSENSLFALLVLSASTSVSADSQQKSVLSLTSSSTLNTSDLLHFLNADRKRRRRLAGWTSEPLEVVVPHIDRQEGGRCIAENSHQNGRDQRGAPTLGSGHASGSGRASHVGIRGKEQVAPAEPEQLSEALRASQEKEAELNRRPHFPRWTHVEG